MRMEEYAIKAGMKLAKWPLHLRPTIEKLNLEHKVVQKFYREIKKNKIDTDLIEHLCLSSILFILGTAQVAGIITSENEFNKGKLHKLFEENKDRWMMKNTMRLAVMNPSLLLYCLNSYFYDEEVREFFKELIDLWAETVLDEEKSLNLKSINKARQLNDG